MAIDLGLALQKALEVVLQSQGTDWEPGDNLALVKCDDRVLKLIGVALDRGLCARNLAATDHVRWGALAMIGGAQALSRIDEGRPRSYATIGEVLKVRGFTEAMRSGRLDAVERGSEQYLGIPIIRGRFGRRFLETMIANSGIDPLLVQAGAARVAASWAWALVADADLEDIAAFVQAHRSAMSLRPGLLELVTSEEGALALADRLRELARFRRLVLERGLVDASAERTRALWCQHGLDPASFLGHPASDALIRAVFDVGRHAELEHAEPRFTWISTDRFRGVGFALPRFLRPAAIPTDCDEIRAVVVDREGTVTTEGVRYVREGAMFRTPRPIVVPLVARSSAPPVHLLVQWEDANDRRELRYASYDLPGRPLTIFGPDGEHVTRPGPGAVVQLALADGWKVERPPSDLSPVAGTAVECWRTALPREPLSLELAGPDGERTSWILGAAAQTRVTARRGQRIPGLRLADATVFTTWPDIEAEGFDGRVLVEVQTPGGHREKRPALARNGRIRVAPFAAPGLYVIRVATGERSARTRFVLLPGARFCVDYLPPDRDGARAVRLRAESFDARLTPTDPDATCSGGTILFPPGASGDRAVGVALPALELAGTWTAGLHPCSVRLLADGTRPLPQPWRIRECSASAVLEITGLPGASVDVEAMGKRCELVLGAEGRRRLRLMELPPGLLQAQKGRIGFRWAGDRIDVEYRNGSLDRPKLIVSDRFARIVPAQPLADAEVVAEVLPVWEPWTEFRACAVRPVAEHGVIGYEVELPEAPGRYVVGLAQRGRAVTGLCLVEVPGGIPAFASQLSRLLWERDTPRNDLRIALGYEDCDVLERLARRVNRYGHAYFNVAKPLRDVACRGLAQMLARGRSVEDTELFRLLVEYDLDLLVLRYSDLGRIAPASGQDPYAMELLDELAGRAIGLAVAAFRAWPKDLVGPRLLELLRPWAPIADGSPVRLTSDDLDLIRTPDAPELLQHRERMAGSPRVQGLVQARKAEKALIEDATLRDIALRYLGDGDPPASYWALAGTEAQRLPPATARLDAVAFACASAVHRWRLGLVEIDVCRDARRISRHARSLMDYWLNLAAARHEGELT
jgi:hypothetical protein